MFKQFKKSPSNIKEFTDITGTSVRDIFAGNILTKKNLTKQWKLISLLIILAFYYISNRYSCEQKIAEIDRLQETLQDVKLDALSSFTKLMINGKQSEVQKKINNQNIKLTESTTPPYKITLE